MNVYISVYESTRKRDKERKDATSKGNLGPTFIGD